MKNSTLGSTGLSARRLRIGGNRMTTDRTLFGVGRTVLAAPAVSAGTVLGGVSDAKAQHWLMNSQEWFQLDEVRVVEGEPVVFTVQVPEKLAFAVRWRYETEDASATAGSDYIGSQGTLQFNIGERMKRITVQTLEDDTVEVVPEFFQLQLMDMETSTDGVIWKREGYIPRLPEYAATTGTIRDANVPLDLLNPPDDPDKALKVQDRPDEPQPNDEADTGERMDDAGGGGAVGGAAAASS